MNQPVNGVFSAQLAGTLVTINGIPAPIIYTSDSQISAVVPYATAGSGGVGVSVTNQGAATPLVQVAAAATAPSFFSQNASGAGQIAAVNLDGSFNDAAHPVKVGGYVSLYATGEGGTSPAGVDGKLASSAPYPQPSQQVKVTIGGVPVTPVYAGAAPTLIAGLMQLVVQIPAGVQPGGYVPVVLTVGNTSTVDGAAWIAVAAQ